MSVTTLLTIIKYISKSKSAAVKDIAITDISGQNYQYCIDIGHGDVNPPLSVLSCEIIVITRWLSFSLCVCVPTEVHKQCTATICQIRTLPEYHHNL